MKTLYKLTITRTSPIILLLSMMITACDEFIAIDPPKTEIVSAAVFENELSAKAALSGIYSLMMSSASFTRAGLEEYTGILSDEMLNYSTRPDQVQFFQNSLNATNTDVLSVFWREAFKYILNANTVLEGVVRSSALSQNAKDQFIGEAKFIRAYCYFHLVNLFGEVPYLETSDYRINANAPRSSISLIHASIEADLLHAQSLLRDDFAASGGERTRPNRGAATALLARHYLYTQQWSKADQYASMLIDNTATYSLLQNLNSVFLANSMEAIWQLKPVVPGANTPQGQLFILSAAPNAATRRVSLTAASVNAFEAGDERKNRWVGSFTNASGTWYYCHKYKVAVNPVVSEYSMMFRIAEQFLIRAEARANLNNLDGARADLNAIRQRANLSASAAMDKSSILLAIEHERRVELFAEGGHRWFDLKRSGNVDAVLTPAKADWQPSDVLLPIPESERLLNPNLTQNDGY
jgi:hypothetical protein